MNTKKFLLAGVIAVSLALALLSPPLVRANEPVADTQTIYDDLVAGSTTVNVFTNGGTVSPQRSWFTLRPGMPLTLSLYASETNAGTENITVKIATTLSTTNLDTAHVQTFSAALISATANTYITTNFDTGWIGANTAAAIVSVQNGHGSYVRVKIKKNQWNSNP